MAINMMKMKIGDKMCDVVDSSEYAKHPEFYDPQYTAIKIDEEMTLPIINKTDYSEQVVGAYPTPFAVFYNKPDEDEKSIYDSSQIIDFRNVKDYKEVIEKSTMVKSLENKILENSDNITVIKPDDNDEPEMAALKEDINCKNCDINLYGPRFDGNFANDRRILSDNSITLTKLKKYGDAMDMKITLSIEDKDPNIPNPIGKTISVELTGGGNE